MTEIQYNLFKTIKYLVIDYESNDMGWVILLDLIPNIPDDICLQMMQDINNGILDTLLVNDNDDTISEKYIEKFNNIILNEFQPKSFEQRRALALKKKALAKIGDRAKSLEFKKNFVYDSKLRRFVKRKHPLTNADIKKKAKLMKKLHKKANFQNNLEKGKKYAQTHKISV